MFSSISIFSVPAGSTTTTPIVINFLMECGILITLIDGTQVVGEEFITGVLWKCLLYVDHSCP